MRLGLWMKIFVLQYFNFLIDLSLSDRIENLLFKKTHFSWQLKINKLPLSYISSINRNLKYKPELGGNDKESYRR